MTERRGCWEFDNFEDFEALLTVGLKRDFAYLVPSLLPQNLKIIRISLSHDLKNYYLSYWDGNKHYASVAILPYYNRGIISQKTIAYNGIRYFIDETWDKNPDKDPNFVDEGYYISRITWSDDEHLYKVSLMSPYQEVTVDVLKTYATLTLKAVSVK